MSFAVRSLPSTIGLDGAFRVHVLPEHLDQAGLKLGDLCEITSEDGTAVGYGVSWRATDKMGTNPKVRPAKMTEILRTAYAIRDGSHVMLHQTDAKTVRAEKVFLTDVTPSEYVVGHEDDFEDGRWRTRCAMVLCNSDASATGVSFDVNAKKGLRKRFYIDHITSSETQPGPPNLYYFDDRTEVIFNEAGSPPTSESVHSATKEEPLSERYIGGLHDQIQDLNERLKLAIGDVKNVKPSHRRFNKPVLLHGFEGTGKSHVLEQLELTRLCNVVRLDKDTLDSPSISKNRDAIKEIFQKARNKQPSVVLMDDIHKIAPTDDETYVRTLIRELKNLAGSHVLVIAASRSPSDINNALLYAGRFAESIELPVPDQKAREQILKVLLRDEDDTDDVIAKAMSTRTHGFTGRDLDLLYSEAEQAATKGMHMGEATPNDLPDPIVDEVAEIDVNGIVEPLQNGHTYSHADTYFSPLKLSHFTAARAKIRPTALREVIFEPPKITWSDIGGSKDLQERLDQIIMLPLDSAEAMASWNKRPTKGVLLYGPPGCSKTLTAQAIATKYGLNFIAIKGGELISMYVGESERAMRELFRKARAAKPCVIFFDEIDSIASVRESSASKGLNILTTLLTEMDGFNSSEGVLILAATNRPEALDPAILRPGRFDAHFYLGLPNENARKEILQIFSKNAPVVEDFDLDKLAKATEGHTGAELAKVWELATDAVLGRRHGQKIGEGTYILNMEDMELGIAQTKKGVTLDVLDGYQAFGQANAGV